jgi:hypothetical protein
MSEVAAWDPVDGNNNSAPPNGFPENMAPSGLNDACRMMMGALRRMYDTFTAQFTALPTTYLRLTGGTLRDGTDIARFDVSGTYNVTGSWGFISDATVKQDIEPYERGLDAIMRLEPVSYTYRAGAPVYNGGVRQYGLVAQEVGNVIPEMVGELDGLKTLTPGHLHYISINAIKELAGRIEALEKRR